MDALKLRKGVSKPGLLREVFDLVVEEVCGRKFSTGARLTSGRKCICAICTSQDASARFRKEVAHRHPMHRTRVRFYLVDYAVEQMFDADPRL